MNKTQEEILEKINEIKGNDILGTKVNDLVNHLDFEHAKRFLNDGVTKEEWDSREMFQDPKKEMINYMAFAWDKANNFRGLSAYRSINHFSAWLWLDGNDELSESILDYEFYGKPQLVQICEYLGLDSSEWDDGVRRNEEYE